MSYSILLTRKKGELDEIPLSTHDFFHEYWLPLFQRYRLTNLQNIQYSHYITEKELHDIIQELKQLQPHVKEDRNQERLVFILTRIEGIRFDDYSRINIG